MPVCLYIWRFEEGLLTIHQMKEYTGMLVKEIMPALHQLQEAFLIYEDQNEEQDERGWYKFGEMFPEVNLNRYSRTDALKFCSSASHSV